MKRLLVSGTRRGINPDVLTDALGEALAALGGDIGNVMLVHGGATGVDTQCGLIWAEWGGQVEIHPADWRKHGKAAGSIRNQEMVDLGADLCYAFPDSGSKGTYDCVERALKAHTHTVVVGPFG